VAFTCNLTFWQSPTHGNQPPVANAGPDQTVPADADGFATVTLDGSATTDADGDELLYWWELDGESFADGVNPTEHLCIGNHLIQLVVRDPVDTISTDEVQIIVTGVPTFIRADSNNDGTVDISDAINTLGYLFSGTGSLTCQDAADANDSGILDISDPIFTLGFLFLGAPVAIPTPYPTLGPDPTPDPLGCERC